jgi:hypothetical protein
MRLFAFSDERIETFIYLFGGSFIMLLGHLDPFLDEGLGENYNLDSFVPDISYWPSISVND